MILKINTIYLRKHNDSVEIIFNFGNVVLNIGLRFCRVGTFRLHEINSLVSFMYNSEYSLTIKKRRTT